MRLAVAIVLIMAAGCKTGGQDAELKALPASMSNDCSFFLAQITDAGNLQPPPNYFNLKWDVFQSLAEASKLAYRTPSEIRQTALSWGFKTVDVTEEGSLAAFVASNDKCMIVSFRGTDDIRDWLVNSQIVGKSVHFGRVHSGFAKGLETIKARVLNYVKWQGGKDKQVWVTGHSLGGALAGVFAYEVSILEPALRPAELEYVVTFGQPLFADDDLAFYMGNTYRRRYFRLVNETDIVARVPPGYKHFGTLAWFHDGQVVYRPQLSSAVAAAAPAGVGTEFPQPDDGQDASQPLPVDDQTLDQDEFEAFMAGHEDPAADLETPGLVAASVPASAAAPVAASAAPATPAAASAGINIDDHRMPGYLRRIGEQLGIND